MNIKNPIEAKNILHVIYNKYLENNILSLEEEEILGLFLLREVKNIHQLDDNTFQNYKFRHLYLIYYSDLSFKETFYKLNLNINSSEIIEYKTLYEMNRKEFDQSNFDNFTFFCKEFNILTPIKENEIEIDKKFLEKIALEWAQEMIKENHKNRNLFLLSKETRDTIKKKNLLDYINNNLSENLKIDIFKALLKSKHIHIETLKIIEQIGVDEIILNLRGINIYYNYGSLIHILNRHFAKISSNNLIYNSKTFHPSEINPCKLHHTLDYIFKKINSKKITLPIESDLPIFIKYKKRNYALYFKTDKFNKCKLNINTFYLIDENTTNGKNDIEKIKNSLFIKLSSNLGLYSFLNRNLNKKIE
ncbi:hypothetical protein [Flavobacterium covae]|uniref:hypothetical protein n=1 Tax=Flavobacterium covae TaxID=2906076 RepID=UPI003399BFC5